MFRNFVLMNLFKVFSTFMLGVIATLIFHGALLMYFLFTSLDTPPVDKVEKRVIPLTDVEVMTEEQVEQMQDQTSDQLTQAENTVVNQADDRESSMTDYGQWSKDQVDQEVKERLKAIEEAEYAKRREEGYKIPEYHESDDNEESKTNGESTIDPNKVGEKKYGGVAHVEYYLKDRTHRDLPSPAYVGAAQGKVVVNVRVDEFGDVKDAEINENMSTTRDPNLWEYALKYAQKSRFDFVKNGPRRQEGTITYIFESQ